MKIYFRPDQENQEEMEVAQDILGDSFTTNLGDIQPDDLVVCRYSFLPFARWVEEQIKHQGARTINTYAQHEYIAQMFWYDDIQEYAHDRDWETTRSSG